MPPKKLSGARRSRDDKEPDNFDETVNVDPLIIRQDLQNKSKRPERPFTVSRLFKEKLNDGLGSLMDVDWSDLRKRLQARNPSDKPWFLQVGAEEVGSEPAPGKFTGEVYQVQFVGVAEAESSHTLAPYTFVIREHRANADIEDCQPEKIRDMEEFGFRWLEIVADDESPINCFLLVTKSEATTLLEKEKSFGFGAVASTKDWSKPAADEDAAEQTKKVEETSSNNTATSGFGNAFSGFGQQQQQSSAPQAAANNTTNNFATGFGGDRDLSNGGASVNNSFALAGFGGSNSSSSTSNTNNNTNTTNNFSSGFGGGGGFGGVSWGSNSNNNTDASSSTVSQPSTTTAGGFGGFGGFGASGSTTTASTQENKTTQKQEDAAAASFVNNNSSDNNNNTSITSTVSSGIPRDAADVQFQIYGKASLKEMKEITTAGSKIVLIDVPLKDNTKWKKLKMENDLKDKLPTAVQDAIDKQFAKSNEDMQALLEWIEECPQIDPDVIEPLTQVRARALKLAKAESPEEYEKLSKYKDELSAALKEVVEERKKEIEEEKKLLKRVEDDLKRKKILPRESWKLLKFHPKNDVVKFRPHDKFRILGKVDECFPPAFDGNAARQNSSFFKSS